MLTSMAKVPLNNPSAQAKKQLPTPPGYISVLTCICALVVINDGYNPNIQAS